MPQDPNLTSSRQLAKNWINLPKNSNSTKNLSDQAKFLYLSGYKLKSLSNYPIPRATPYSQVSFKNFGNEALTAYKALIKDAANNGKVLRNAKYLPRTALLRNHIAAPASDFFSNFTISELRQRTLFFDALSTDHPDKPRIPATIIKKRLCRDHKIAQERFVPSQDSMSQTESQQSAQLPDERTNQSQRQETQRKLPPLELSSDYISHPSINDISDAHFITSVKSKVFPFVLPDLSVTKPLISNHEENYSINRSSPNAVISYSFNSFTVTSDSKIDSKIDNPKPISDFSRRTSSRKRHRKQSILYHYY